MKSFLHNFRSSRSTISPATDLEPKAQNDFKPAEAYHTDASGELSACITNCPLSVVELFQSQGCNSCPPTNANLLRATSSSTPVLPDAIFLTYHVTYWDYLGWKDTFGNSAFDRRQRDYVSGLGLRNAFTPQVIVNGRASGVGNTKAGLDKVLKEGGAGQVAPAVKVAIIHDNKNNKDSGEDLVVQVSLRNHAAVLSHDLDVWAVRFDPSEVNVAIKSGENRNEVLPHKNVVRSVQKVGVVRADGKDAGVMSLGKMDGGLEGVILVSGWSWRTDFGRGKDMSRRTYTQLAERRLESGIRAALHTPRSSSLESRQKITITVAHSYLMPITRLSSENLSEISSISN